MMQADSFPSRTLRQEEQDIAGEVKQRITAAVETESNYRHVLAFALFVAVYMVALYLQASAYATGEVVATLRTLLPPSGLPQHAGETPSQNTGPAGSSHTSVTFYGNEQVLDYIESQLIKPFWQDPLCGDGVCDDPFEFPSFGRFGCRADCGAAPNTTRILVRVSSNFAGHPLLSPRVLMAAASWNLCLLDPARRRRGDSDLCWFEKDQPFTEVTATRLETMDVVDGRWYVYVHGDFAGRVSGAVFNIMDPDHPQQLQLSPGWDACKMPRRSQLVANTAAIQEAKRHSLPAGAHAGEDRQPAAGDQGQASTELR